MRERSRDMSANPHEVVNRVPKAIRMVVGLLAAAIGIQWVVQWSMNRDSYRSDIERFIRDDPRVATRVGVVESMTMVRLVIMQAGDVSRAGREYEYVVSGRNGTTRAVVTLDTDTRSPAAERIILRMPR
jgi:hypothetical protein